MILLMLSKSVTFLATPPPGSQGLYENLSFIAEFGTAGCRNNYI